MITSLANKKIKEVFNIKKKYSYFKNSAFFIESKRIFKMALNLEVTIKRVFYTNEIISNSEGANLLKKISKKNTEVFEISKRIMDKLSDTDTPQGIVGVVSTRKYGIKDLKDKKDLLILVCDRLKDPGNLGSIIRSSDAFGADAVIILPKTCNPFSPKVVRSSAGSIFNIPIIFENTKCLIKWVKLNNLRLIATDTYDGINISQVNFKSPFALIVGEEAEGVRTLLKRESDFLVNIPIEKRVESLNVAVSSAICLYEASKQRKGSKN